QLLHLVDGQDERSEEAQRAGHDEQEAGDARVGRGGKVGHGLDPRRGRIARVSITGFRSYGMLFLMRLRLVAASAATALLLAGCSGGGDDGPPEPVEGRTSPLTGTLQEQPPDNPAFLVKIENTDAGTPQYGLNDADLV